MIAPCTDPSPPTPGVSTSTSPVRRIALGTETSAACRLRSLPRVPELRRVLRQVSEGNRLSDGVGARLGRLVEHPGPQLVAVVDDGGDGCGDVVVDGTHVHPDERVHERALALLELADDEHPDRGVGQATPRRVEPGREVGTLVGLDRAQRGLDDGQRARCHGRHARGVDRRTHPRIRWGSGRPGCRAPAARAGSNIALRFEVCSTANSGASSRNGSPSGASTLTTSAPASASSFVQ